MRTYTAIVEKCSETGCFVGYVPEFPGVHTQGEFLDELGQDLRDRSAETVMTVDESAEILAMAGGKW